MKTMMIVPKILDYHIMRKAALFFRVIGRRMVRPASTPSKNWGQGPAPTLVVAIIRRYSFASVGSHQHCGFFFGPGQKPGPFLISAVEDNLADNALQAKLAGVFAQFRRRP
jgi:hypothetical protein